MKDIHEQVTRSRKLALYASLRLGGYYTVCEVKFTEFGERYERLPAGELREQPLDGYVRVSEPIDASFTPLSNDAVIQKAVESLNEAERKAVEELNAKIAAIREQKAQLLSLTHQPETV